MTPPPMASYGLHYWYLSLHIPISHLHHPWAPNGLYLGILRNCVPSSWLHLQWPPMVSITDISVCVYPSLISTSHGLLRSSPRHTQKVCAFFMTAPNMASYGLHNWYLSLILPIYQIYLPWATLVSIYLGILRNYLSSSWFHLQET